MNEVTELDFTRFIETGHPQIKSKKVRATGEVPDARWGHSASIREGKMFICGGRNQDDLNDLFSFDCETFSWEYVDCVGAPVARRRHSSAFVGKALFSFGGFDGSFFNDFHMINLEPFTVPVGPCHYSQDLKNLVNNPADSDITFKIGSKVIYAHKKMLLYRWTSDLFSDAGIFFEKIISA